MHYLGYYFNLKGTDTNSSIKETRKKSLKAAIIMKFGLIKKVGIGNSGYYRLLLKGYVTFIRPHLDYTMFLLAANKTYVSASDRIQKSVVKYLFGLNQKIPSAFLYALLPIETITQISNRLTFSLGLKLITNIDTCLYSDLMQNNTKNFKHIKNTYEKYKYDTRIIPRKLLKDFKNDFLKDNRTLVKQITPLGFYDYKNIRYNNFTRLLNILKEEKFIHLHDIVAFFIEKSRNPPM
ncbi:hypothetical protein CWI39_0849p0010 [Hamiltosporidium magnivora]|uniref:Uncharacterized protein n=1 Tax=Hamiltosporidium magnivora TaxID=148818 RepID=A0A4Q9L8V3_9MICR|nr:hypothetical protein CWI39_0849p0010 [Hamiltosporidium magnivora]